MANPNQPPSTQVVDRFASQSGINGEDFNLTAAQTVVLDSDPYINNKVIQVNTFNSGLSVSISLDGKVFFPGPAISGIGIYPVTLPCRYVKLTASGNCSGLVFGSI
jgi:hypothetical protein